MNKQVFKIIVSALSSVLISWFTMPIAIMLLDYLGVAAFPCNTTKLDFSTPFGMLYLYYISPIKHCYVFEFYSPVWDTSHILLLLFVGLVAFWYLVFRYLTFMIVKLLK